MPFSVEYRDHEDRLGYWKAWTTLDEAIDSMRQLRWQPGPDGTRLTWATGRIRERRYGKVTFYNVSLVDVGIERPACLECPRMASVKGLCEPCYNKMIRARIKARREKENCPS